VNLNAWLSSGAATDLPRSRSPQQGIGANSAAANSAAAPLFAEAQDQRTPRGIR
jgi:hypothetical protein